MSKSENTKKVINAMNKLTKISVLSVNELRIIVAIERLIARIDYYKPLETKLIFKGGFVLLKAYNSLRFTRDIDALAVEISKDQLIKDISEALSVDLEDGISFAPFTVKDLTHGDYGGFRFIVPFQIGDLPKEEHKIKKLSCLHFDVAFDDKINRFVNSSLKELIPQEKPISWSIYPIENIFAEKLQTLVSRESFNSRAKDLYDIVLISEQIGELKKAIPFIQNIFKNRNTEIPKSFSNFFNNLDLSLLEKSWNSVTLLGMNMSFKECCVELNKILKNIDSMMVPFVNTTKS